MKLNDEPLSKIPGYFFLLGIFIGIALILTITNTSIEVKNSEDLVESFLYANAPHYLADYTVYGSIAYTISEEQRETITCESGWRQYKKNGEILRGDTGEYGIAQFMDETFEWFRTMSGMNELSIYNAEDQIILMKWAFENGYEDHWTCYRDLYQ